MHTYIIIIINIIIIIIIIIYQIASLGMLSTLHILIFH